MFTSGVITSGQEPSKAKSKDRHICRPSDVIIGSVYLSSRKRTLIYLYKDIRTRHGGTHLLFSWELLKQENSKFQVSPDNRSRCVSALGFYNRNAPISSIFLQTLFLTVSCVIMVFALCSQGTLQRNRPHILLTLLALPLKWELLKLQVKARS